MKIYAVAVLVVASSAVANPQRVRKGHARRTASSTSHGRVLQKNALSAKEDLMSLSMSFSDTVVAPLVTEAPGKGDETDDEMNMPPAETTEAPVNDVMSMPQGKEEETDDETNMLETTEAPAKEDGADGEMSMPEGPVDTTEAPGKDDETDDEMSMPSPLVDTTEAPGKGGQTDDGMSMPSLPVDTTEVPLTTGTSFSAIVTTTSQTTEVEPLPAELSSMSMSETSESDILGDVDTNTSADVSTDDEAQAPEEVGLIDEEGPAGDDKLSQETDPVVSNIEKSCSVVLGSSAAAIAITGAMMFI